MYGKRDLVMWQMGHDMAKGPYEVGKRDLLIWQKRPTYMAKKDLLT